MAKQSQRSLRTNELVRAASKTNTVPSTITSEKEVCLETFAQRLTKLCQTCQEHTQKAKEHVQRDAGWFQVSSSPVWALPSKEGTTQTETDKVTNIFDSPPNNSDITTGLIFLISCFSPLSPRIFHSFIKFSKIHTFSQLPHLTAGCR